MRHCYLFEPAVWVGSGTFWRGDGEALQAVAVIEVTHRPEVWLLSGSLRVLCSPPVEFMNAYRIEPATRESGTMRWTSEDPTLGKLRGTYSVVGDCMLSVYRCGVRGYHGAEALARMDENTYRATGALLLDERRLSSWQLLLRREH